MLHNFELFNPDWRFADKVFQLLLSEHLNLINVMNILKSKYSEESSSSDDRGLYKILNVPIDKEGKKLFAKEIYKEAIKLDIANAAVFAQFALKYGVKLENPQSVALKKAPSDNDLDKQPEFDLYLKQEAEEVNFIGKGEETKFD